MNRLTLCALALCFVTYGLVDPLAADDTEAIRAVIQRAYIQGIHIDGDTEAIRSGFHPSFVMFIQTDDGIRQVAIEDWISRIEESKATDAGSAGDKPEVEGEIEVLDQEGAAAVARVKVHRDGKQVFTDFMSLYRFEDGWKIVGKIFHSHR